MGAHGHPGGGHPVVDADSKLEPWQQRVIEEKKELDEKIVKLKAFLDLENFKQLPEGERDFLIRQYYTMRGYAEILGKRIQAF